MHSKLVLVSLGMLMLVCLLQNVDAGPKPKSPKLEKKPSKKGQSPVHTNPPHAGGSPPKSHPASPKANPAHNKPKPAPANADHHANAAAKPGAKHGASPPLPAAGAALKLAKVQGKLETKAAQQNGHNKAGGKGKVAAAVAVPAVAAAAVAAGAGVAAAAHHQQQQAVHPAAQASFLKPASVPAPAPAAYQPIQEEPQQFEAPVHYDNYSPNFLQSYDEVPMQKDFDADEFESYPTFDAVEKEQNYNPYSVLEGEDDMDNLPGDRPAELNNAVQKAAEVDDDDLF